MVYIYTNYHKNKNGYPLFGEQCTFVTQAWRYSFIYMCVCVCTRVLFISITCVNVVVVLIILNNKNNETTTTTIIITQKDQSSLSCFLHQHCDHSFIYDEGYTTRWCNSQDAWNQTFIKSLHSLIPKTPSKLYIQNKHNHRRTVAQPCINSDRLGQWRMPKFDNL